MSTKDNLLQAGIKHLSGLLQPYLESFEDPELKSALWESKNIQLAGGTNGPSVPDQTLANIQAYQDAIDPDLLAFFNAVDDVRKIIDSIRAVAEAHHADGGWGTADELSRQMMSELTLNYFRFRWPFVLQLMRALGVLEEKLDDHYVNRLFWHRVWAFLKDAGGYFKETFGELQTEEDARQLADALFFPTAAVVDFALGKKEVIASYRWDASPDSATPRADALADRTLSALIPMPKVGGEGTPSADVALIASMTFVPAEHGGPGMMLALGGEAEADIPVTLPLSNDAAADGKDGDTTFNLHLELDAPAGGIGFIPLAGGTTLNNFASSASVDFQATFEPQGEFRKRFLGDSKKSRLEFGKPKLSLHFRKMPDRDGFLFDLRVVFQDSAMVLAPGDGDSFIKGVLPPGDATIGLDPGIGLRRNEAGDWGVYLVGGDSLEVTLPGGLKLGPAELKELKTRLVPKDGAGTGSKAQGLSTGGSGRPATLEDQQAVAKLGVEAEVTANLAVKLGPVTAAIDQIGFRLGLDEAEDGNLGLLDLIVGYKAPAGVGIAIDDAGVKGGGFLFFDAEKEQYAGAALLQFEKITFNAVGLLTTRLPDGAEGFALLVMLTAEDFPPVDLGLGFRLTGAGGLVGYNRSVAIDVLRTGLKNKTLDSVLFPEDPIRNAATIVNNLRRVFPPTTDQHLVGLVAKIVWGANDLLTFDLGLVLEFPNPWRIVILGQMRTQLPSRKKGLIKLNLDFFGAIDFDKGEALVLATLYDSKLVRWNVSGDAAFYARWKQDPMFILSAGGFHPSFPAPPELPPVDRLMMVLSKGDSVRLTMTWYLALTSNSFQHGAHAAVLLKGGGFSVDGHIGYDTLVQFDPFGFVIAFSAGVGLRWHGHTLAAVQLEGDLSGPSPWHVHGKATFKIWRFSKSVSVDKTVGDGEALPPPPVVNPKPALLKALAEPGNWAAALPAREEMLVRLRDAPADGVVRVHPLGDVAVRQQVLPLGVSITRFGNARTSGPQRYRIDTVSLGGAGVSSQVPVFDYFSAGQFQELNAGEQLSRPSFEAMTAGIRVATDALTYGGDSSADAAHRRTATLGYETVIFREDDGTSEVQPDTYTPHPEKLEAQVSFGAAAQSSMQRSGNRRFAAVRPAQVEVRPVRYAIARTENLAAAVDLGGGRDDDQGFSAVSARLQAYVLRHPEEAGDYQVVPFYETESPVTP